MLHVTAICFDDGGRRLITGCHDGGELSVWNFSNGCLLRTLVKRPDTEVTLEYRNNGNDSDNHTFNPFVTTGKSKRGGNRSVLNKKLKLPILNTLASAKKVLKREDETTGIICVRISLPRVPGQLSAENKFIISVGWDRKVYIWRDEKSSTAKVQGYLICMPEKKEDGHTDDITCVAFCPPNLIATGGLDGRVILWYLNSGEVLSRFDERKTTIESMVFLDNWSLLLVGTGNGQFIFINTKHVMIHAKA